MKFSESPIITFVRGITLLAVLVALPGIAICWNHLPKDLWSETVPSSTKQKVGKTQYCLQDSASVFDSPSAFGSSSAFDSTNMFNREFDRSPQSASVFAPESIYSALQEPLVLPKTRMEFPGASVAAQNLPTQSHWTPHGAVMHDTVAHNTAIQQVSWEHSPVTQPVTLPQAQPQDFESLGLRLKALGATYYKIEKWGNRGEFFRVSCFVALSENHSHTKYFQAIGTDAITVMQTVIADIERWRGMR